MLFRKNIIRLIPVLLSAIALNGCSSAECTDNGNNDEDGIYMTLSVKASSPTSRATGNPNGGNDGDGSESGINNENTIHALTLFFYKDADANSIESANSSAAVQQIYVDGSRINGNGTTWTTEPFSVNPLTPDTPYHLVVVSNMSTETAKAITTLGSLQNFIQTQAWTGAGKIADYDNFVMSSEFKSADDDKSFKVESYNKKDAPKEVSVSLKRLAARVDIEPMTSTNGAVYADGYYEYPIGTTGDKLRLTDIKLINQLTAGTYLLKHFADADGTEIASATSLIGQEQPVSGEETNYVVDPWTRLKTTTATTMEGKTLDLFYKNYFNTSDATSTWTGDAAQQCAPDKYYILGYTMENTMAQDCQMTKYTTALNLRATYVPASWYVIDGGALTLSKSVTPGQTFYTFGGQFYATPEALTKAVNAKNGTSMDQTAALAATGVNTYTDGVCYYNYCIRHSNNEMSESGIMEFGIVRDNIYRILINSFSAIGTNTPGTDDHHDEDNLGITVKVVPWSIYTHSIIYL